MGLSFVINPAERAVGERASERLNRAFMARLERANSARLIAQARAVYARFLQLGGALNGAPHGVILQGDSGRVVFCLPTLLPEEVFVPGDWLFGPGPVSPRVMRGRSRSQPAWSTPKP
jgi:hypothetical protein